MSSRSPALDDLDGWRTIIEGSNAGIAAMFEMRTADKESTIEVMPVGEVPVFVVSPADTDHAVSGISLDVDGGAFTMGYGNACRAMTKFTAGQLGVAMVLHGGVVDVVGAAPCDSFVAASNSAQRNVRVPCRNRPHIYEQHDRPSGLTRCGGGRLRSG